MPVIPQDPNQVIIDAFKQAFPQFQNDIVDKLLPGLIIDYRCYYCGDYGKACNNAIILNLLAHLLTLATNPSSQAMNPVTSQSVGSVSQSFGAYAGSNGNMYNFFGSTKYGQAFMYLTSKRKGAFFV